MEHKEVTSCGDPPPYINDNDDANPEAPTAAGAVAVLAQPPGLSKELASQQVLLLNPDHSVVVYSVAPTKTYATQLVLSFFTFWCCCCVCGLIAFILAGLIYIDLLMLKISIEI